MLSTPTRDDNNIMFLSFSSNSLGSTPTYIYNGNLKLALVERYKKILFYAALGYKTPALNIMM